MNLEIAPGRCIGQNERIVLGDREIHENEIGGIEDLQRDGFCLHRLGRFERQCVEQGQATVGKIEPVLGRLQEQLILVVDRQEREEIILLQRFHIHFRQGLKLFMRQGPVAIRIKTLNRECGERRIEPPNMPNADETALIVEDHFAARFDKDMRMRRGRARTGNPGGEADNDGFRRKFQIVGSHNTDPPAKC